MIIDVTSSDGLPVVVLREPREFTGLHVAAPEDMADDLDDASPLERPRFAQWSDLNERELRKLVGHGAFVQGIATRGMKV